MGKSSRFILEGLSPRVAWSLFSNSKHAVRALISVLPEDPTWTIAFCGVGFTVAYFALRSKEISALEKKETTKAIVERDRGVFMPREKLAQYILFFCEQQHSRSLLVAGPKNSGVTLLVCNFLQSKTHSIDTPGMPGPKCQAASAHELRTSSRVALGSRCFVGVQGLVNNLQANFPSTKFANVINFIRNLISAFQGSPVGLDELQHSEPGVEGDEAALLHELKKGFKVNINDLTPENHILFLDDMHRFSELAATFPETGRHAMKIFMDAIRTGTKNCRRVAIVGACSPCFCYDILHNVHFKDYYEVCFVGDLSEANAETFYRHLVKTCLSESLQGQLLAKGTFCEVYRCVGGRLGDIRDMVTHLGAVCCEESSPLDAAKAVAMFPQIARHATRLQRLLMSDFAAEELQGSTWEVDATRPLWGREQILQLFNAILASGNPYGCVPFSEALGIAEDHQVLRSMFEHDVLLYRPMFPLHEDYVPNRFRDHVAPYSPLDLYCIQELLTHAELQNRNWQDPSSVPLQKQALEQQ